MTIIPRIIEQHAEDAAFNWLIRNYAVSEPHYGLAHLTHLDDRVEANIDGLRIAGDAGWEICLGAMGIEEQGEIFTAAVLAFESLSLKCMDAALELAFLHPGRPLFKVRTPGYRQQRLLACEL